MTSKLLLNHCIKKSDKGKLREEKIWMILFVIYQESWFRWIICDTLTRHPSAWTAQETGYMRLALSTSVQLSSVQSLIHVRLFATPWTAALQASLSITNSRSPPKLMSTESEMPSNHLILCHSLLLLPSIFPSIRVFANESALHIRWPKYCSFSFSISPSNEHPGLISFRMDWLDLLAVQGTLKSPLQHHSSKCINSSAFSFLYSSLLTSIHDHWKKRPLLTK